MPSSSIQILFAFLLVVTYTYGHSQMRCANWDVRTRTCKAPIRNQVVSFESEGNDMQGGGGICQSPMSNPINAAYSNGKGCPDYAGCPLPMGTMQQGENITVMWLARNHAVADQTPGNIAVYLSPALSMDAGMDVSTSVFANNKFCEAPFMSCNGQNGNMVECYTTCRIPANTEIGIHTIWWKWVWNGHTSIYSTCADVYITAGSSQSNQPSTPSTPTPVSVPSTTARPIQSTTSTPVAATNPAPVAATTKASTPSTTAAAQVSSSSSSGSVPVTPVAPVAPVTPTNPPSGICIVGNRICSSRTSYMTCSPDRVGTRWAGPQFCSPGTFCVPDEDGINIRCK